MKYSLIVPVAPNRDAPILECIKNLDYPKHEYHVLVIYGTNPSVNRNKGIERSKGQFVVFLDDDAIIEKDYLKKIDEFFINHPNIDIVGGPQLTPKDDRWFAKVSGYALSSTFGAWKLSNRYDLNSEKLQVDETALTSANLVCKKSAVEKIKFDPSLFPGEDPKFISDAKRAGFSVAYTPRFILYHKRRPTFNGLMKQMFNYGKVRPKKEKFIETLSRPYFIIPSIFFVYVLALMLVSLMQPSITGSVIGLQYSSWGFYLFLPLIAYLFLMLFFALYDSVRNRDATALFLLPLLYPLIHLSYGAGMLFGYVKKTV
ncbi:glycosyltransferase [Candidatus Pacearchaeota archaeon]|nr:glycosyltransferase [Candidatus Pacearchaeota archaeon]